MRCWNWTIGPPNQSCLLISRWWNLAKMLEIVGIKCVISSTLRTSSHKSHLCLNTTMTPVTLSGKRHLWAADHFSLDRLEAEQSSMRMFSVVSWMKIFDEQHHTWGKSWSFTLTVKCTWFIFSLCAVVLKLFQVIVPFPVFPFSRRYDGQCMAVQTPWGEAASLILVNPLPWAAYRGGRHYWNIIYHNSSGKFYFFLSV